MVIIEENDVVHFGILRRSGRYPWGSGDNTTEQKSRTFLDVISDLKARLGWGDKDVAKYFEISSTELRQLKSIAKESQKASQIAMAQRLKDKGYKNTAIAERMGLSGESQVRALLAPGAADKANVIRTTADMLRAEMETKPLLDVGSGVENWVGVSKERKDTAIALLIEEGYTNHYIDVPQLGTGKDTTTRVLGPPGMSHKEAFARRGEVRTIGQLSDDGGRSYYGIVDPISIKSDRIQVRYGEEGGAIADGVIYVRPGVDDLSLGGSRYAQVRIKVDEHHYIKGMAIYKDDLPEGVDLLFNTNKSDTGNKIDALKDMQDESGYIDPDNPFGSYIRRQIVVKGDDGIDRATSAMNIVNEEGNWGGGIINPKTGDPESGWTNSIASQVLSKQHPELARAQLDMTYDRRQTQFNEIMALTNPTVRRRLLQEFSDGTDAASVHLAAAALPRQSWQVVLPINTLKDNEIFAPNYRDGEKVALIRYPHGGTFEIPELTVNNKHRDSIRIIGRQARDAVGINSKTAERLSGADFDGDTVLVIPNNNQRIRHTPALDSLQGFDPKSNYPPYDGMRTIDGGTYNATTRKVEYKGKPPDTGRKQNEMGDVSNLITDMTIKGASHGEIARAVRHSMAVIDAEKHALNYRLSFEQNGIASLKEKYQGGANRGASTIVSLAKSPVRVNERNPRRASRGGPIDPVTGRRVFEDTERTYVNKKGETVANTTRVKRLDLTDDANTLSSGTRMEALYANHSNRLKDLANKARVELLNTPRAPYSGSAAVTYKPQVDSLNAKLDTALRNRPLERQAQVLANATFRQRKAENPHMDVETQRKIKFQALEEARRRSGAKRLQIEITADEWEAIQAGAISDSKLDTILQKSNMDTVRNHATPRIRPVVSTAMLARARQMVELGYTRSEIEAHLGVAKSTLGAALDGTSETSP